MKGLSSARVNSAEKDFLYNSGFLVNQRSSWASKSSYIVFDFYYVMFGSFCIFHNFELSLKRSRRKTQVEYLKTFASGHLLLKTLVIIQVSVHEVSIPRQSKTLYDKEHEVVP